MNSGVYVQQKKALCALTSLLMANVDIGIAILFKVFSIFSQKMKFR